VAILLYCIFNLPLGKPLESPPYTFALRILFFIQFLIFFYLEQLDWRRDPGSPTPAAPLNSFLKISWSQFKLPLISFIGVKQSNLRRFRQYIDGSG